MGKPRNSTLGLFVSKTAISRGTKKMRRTVSELGRFIETSRKDAAPEASTAARLTIDSSVTGVNVSGRLGGRDVRYCNVNKQNELRRRESSTHTSACCCKPVQMSETRFQSTEALRELYCAICAAITCLDSMCYIESQKREVAVLGARMRGEVFRTVQFPQGFHSGRSFAKPRKPLRKDIVTRQN